MKPLEGIKVLDFSQIHGATFSTMLLADFGAEVVKVEKPGEGDKLRAFGPKIDGYSAYHAYLNRGKKSIAVDLKTEEGKNIIKELVKEFDVVVENFRYGKMDELGLGYDVLSAINPKLVYASLTGYGRSGEKKERACFDNTAQAFSSMLDMTGYGGGAPITMAQLANQYGGIHLALGIVLAMIHVKKGGEGQMIDVSASDSLFSALEDGMVDIEFNGHHHIRNGNMSQAIAPYDTYATKDGFVSIGVSTDDQWEKFCKALGLEELLGDPRYATNSLRGQHYLEGGLRAKIEAFTETKTKFEIEEILSEQKIPCGSVCTTKEAIDSEQMKHRQMVITVDDPVVGKVTMPGVVAKLGTTPGCVSKPAPQLGEDTEEVLKAAGIK
ncbi:MAG: CoA transferase [Firmicutes bacterium]|nr:CoA transferase [Bacillota bacterium]